MMQILPVLSLLAGVALVTACALVAGLIGCAVLILTSGDAALPAVGMV